MCKKQSLDETKKQIMHDLKVYRGEQLDVCYQIYKVIVSTLGKEAEALRFFLENSELIEPSNEERVKAIFSKEESLELEEMYVQMINGMLAALLTKNLSVNEFYEELWGAIVDNPILKEEKVKVFALYYIWIDMRIPYFQLDKGIKMSNEEFADITRQRLDDIKKMRFIMTAPLEQKTERASLLLNMLDTVKEKKEKTVLMVHMLAMSSRNHSHNEADE